MNIVSVTATYNRPKILKDTLEILGNIRGLQTRIVVGSLGEDGVVAKACGAEYYEFANKPLGAKWQHGITQAKKHNPDAVLICGSDDWLTEDWIEHYWPLIQAGADLAGRSRWVACNVGTQKTVFMGFKYSQDIEPIGPGRMFSGRFLDRIGWNLFIPNVNSGLDRDSAEAVKKVSGRIIIDNTGSATVACVKSNWDCRNTFESYMQNKFLVKTPVTDGVALMNACFPGRIQKYLT